MIPRVAVLLTLILALGTAGAETVPPAGTPAGTLVPAFSVSTVDVTGAQPKTTTIDSRRTEHVTAYVIVGTGCPATNAYADRLKQLEQAYRPKGVEFVYVYPNREDTPERKLSFHKERGFTGRLIDDQGGRIALALGAQRTSEVFLVSRRGELFYRGAVDDSKENPQTVKHPYVATALDEQLAGKPITTPASQVFA